MTIGLKPGIGMVAALAAVGLCGCTAQKPDAANASNGANVVEAVPNDILPQNGDAPTTSSSTPVAASKVIGLEGLDALKIGAPVPTGSDWAERGGQTGAECRTVTSPRYPGVYAIVEKGKLQRITVGQRSDVKLAEGVGVGASEADARKWFAGFRDEPHKYEKAPAKYLTAPNAANGSSALRLEIGKDGKVSMIHVGLMPALAYVEGCS